MKTLIACKTLKIIGYAQYIHKDSILLKQARALHLLILEMIFKLKVTYYLYNIAELSATN